MKLYRERKKDLYMVLIDIEKAYDRVPHEVLWRYLNKEQVSASYIRVIKDMYTRVKTRVKTFREDTDDLLLTLGSIKG